MTKPTLLIVEDDEDIRTQMKWALASDYEVRMAGDRAEARGGVHGQPALGHAARSRACRRVPTNPTKAWRRSRRCSRWIRWPR